ncbi:universal stress protein [Natrialbaceae archaeon A-arb3/5]
MRILVPMDGSDPAHAAVEHAVATHSDDEIIVLHVINPSPPSYGGDVPYNYDQIVETAKKNAEGLLDTAREIGDEHGVSIETETTVGTPARGIVEFAAENDIDQIVLGSHGRTGVSRVLLGSVAEQVVRRATVPVTVVR